MIVLVDFYIEVFVKVGVDYLIVYLEVGLYFYCILQVICVVGMKLGIVFNFGILVEVVDLVMDDIDLILVMLVNLGFGGQSFIESQL